MALTTGDFRDQSRQVWSYFRRPQGIALAVVGVGMIALLSGVGVWAQTPSYRVLFSSMTEEDAAAVVSQLQERQIPYQIEASGTRILVPDRLVEDTRLQLASSRLPSSGSGFELFDKTQLGATDYAQRITYQRALEGELARTVTRVSAVEQARVHLAIPAPTLYLDREKPATASVMVRLKPGQRLSDGQIRGIAHLVSGSVPGLLPEHLNIVDTAGNVLSTQLGKSAGNSAPGSDPMTAQSDLESRIERDVLTMLERILGPGKASARASATLNWDQEETSSETFSPAGDKPLVRSAKELSEGYDRPSAAGGTPGTTANLPSYQQPGSTAQGQGNYTRKEMQTNYEMSKTVAKVVKASGSLVRLSVAVALDGTVAISAEQLGQLRDLVAAAAGIDPKRGDVLSITALPFTAPPAEDLSSLEMLRQQEVLLESIRTGGMVLGPTLLLFVLFFMLRRFRNAPSPAYARVAALRGDAQRSPGALAEPAAYRLEGSLQNALPSNPPDHTAALRQLSQVARADPQLLTQTIAAWLEEEKEEEAVTS